MHISKLQLWIKVFNALRVISVYCKLVYLGRVIDYLMIVHEYGSFLDVSATIGETRIVNFSIQMPHHKSGNRKMLIEAVISTTRDEGRPSKNAQRVEG
jgi:uncharacterized membrane protein